MNRMVCLTLVCIATLAYLQTASAIKCYVCAGCNDPWDKAKASSIQTQECAGSCVKAKADSTVARSCSPTKMKTDCQKAEAGGHTAEACYCDTDLCNSSSSVYVSIATGVMATLAVILSKVM